jgi:hypothetical protein
MKREAWPLNESMGQGAADLTGEACLPGHLISMRVRSGFDGSK